MACFQDILSGSNEPIDVSVKGNHYAVKSGILCNASTDCGAVATHTPFRVLEMTTVEVSVTIVCMNHSQYQRV